MENATADAAAVVAAGWQGQAAAMSGSEARAAGLTGEIYSKRKTFLGKNIPSIGIISMAEERPSQVIFRG